MTAVENTTMIGLSAKVGGLEAKLDNGIIKPIMVAVEKLEKKFDDYLVSDRAKTCFYLEEKKAEEANKSTQGKKRRSNWLVIKDVILVLLAAGTVAWRVVG